ncbi:MAG: hypothetical protein E4G90_02565, partial [Gemmatimonadales bacterium]
MPWQETAPVAPEPIPGPEEAVDLQPTSAVDERGAREMPPQDQASFEMALADSIADARVLEQLAMVLAPGSDAADRSLETFGETGTGLDLTTYADHPRIQFYLDFFMGEARPRMEVWLQRLPRYESMVRDRFEAEGLPTDLVYLGLIESGYSNVAVSRSRAVGMWQFMAGTARWMGLR